MNTTYIGGDIGEELLTQDAVHVKNVVPQNNEVDFSHNSGILSVVNYPGPIGICVEWRQSEVTVESEDQDWAVVQDTKEIRKRTISGCGISLRPPTIQLSAKTLYSFCLSRNGREITFNQDKGASHTCFNFQRGSAEYFANFLKTKLNTNVQKRDPRCFLIMDQPDIQNLNRSFAELELYQDSSTTVISNFMRNPMETALGAFSKLADVVLYKNNEESMVSLSRSLQEEEEPHPKSTEEYELVNRTPMPPRILISRSPPLRREIWENFFDEDGRITEDDIVKEMIFHGGVDPSLRREVWKYILNYYPWRSTHSEREQLRKSKVEDYYRMKLQWKSKTKEQEDRFSDYKERKSLIEKDVTRTDRTLEFYAADNNPHIDQLQDILMTYVMYNFDLGYVQGMSDLLSPLLYLFEDEVDTFWCFTSVIDRMVRNFDIDQAGMKEQLHQLYQLVNMAEPELAAYLQRQESSNMFFCFRWLLVWFKREFSYDDIYILWETLWVESRCPKYHLLICLAILENEKETLMSNEYGFTEILKHINELSNKIDLTLILKKAEALYQQLSLASEIPNNIREILGLPLLPEPKSEANGFENGDTNGGYYNGNHTHVSDDIEDEVEAAYEQSLTHFI